MPRQPRKVDPPYVVVDGCTPLTPAFYHSARACLRELSKDRDGLVADACSNELHARFALYACFRARSTLDVGAALLTGPARGGRFVEGDFFMSSMSGGAGSGFADSGSASATG